MRPTKIDSDDSKPGKQQSNKKQGIIFGFRVE